MAQTWSFGEDMASVTNDVFSSLDKRMSDSNTDRYISTEAGLDYFESGTYKVSSERPIAVGSKNEDFNIGNYSVVGINAIKAKEVGQRINATVENTLKPLTDKLVIDSSVGFKGNQVTAAFDEYVRNVKGYIQSLISDLEAFSDKLFEIADTYQANDQILGTKISGVVGGAFAASNTMFNPQHATQQASQGYGIGASEETEPASEETEPASEETEPAPEETEPAPEETEPAPEETEPALEETEPAPAETEPAPAETEPAPAETEPAPEVGDPIVDADLESAAE